MFEPYNAADILLAGNLVAGRADRTAVMDAEGCHTYAQVAQRANRFANVLRDCGIQPEQRIVLCLEDSVDFPVCFLGAIRAGVVPVPVNTQLAPRDYAFILADSRARAVVVSAALAHGFRPLPRWVRAAFVAGTDACPGFAGLAVAMDAASDGKVCADTRADDVALWLYSSGTTGVPKAVMHAHTSCAETAQRYGRDVLGIHAGDVIFSAPKLFFAYGLGNALTFPFFAGATTVLLAERATPESVIAVLRRFKPSVFFGVPTLYAMMLNKRLAPERGAHGLRLCVSAGEALPEAVFHRWLECTGLPIVEGIGATETLHMFMSQRPQHPQPGGPGQPVPGCEVSLLDERGMPVPDGEIGDLYVRSSACAIGYWNRLDLSRRTFRGEWLRTGDKFVRAADGSLRHCGRSDDLLKVGGIYVAPAEVENALLTHAAVAEVAVIGGRDADGMEKPCAFVVPATGVKPSPSLEQALIAHVRAILAEYKRPRWIEFMDELPRTVTGKVQRFKLRQRHGARPPC